MPDGVRSVSVARARGEKRRGDTFALSRAAT
jgi:hypothetical protein